MTNPASWSEYSQVFSKLGAAKSQWDAADLFSLLRELRSAGFDSALLAECLCSDGDAVAEVAARSYLHPNGFEKIVLFAPAVDLPSLRLHIWRASSDERPSEQVHNHRWPFASRIEHGAVRFITYEHSADGSDGGEYRHVTATSPATAAESYRHDIVGSARLRMTFDGVLAAGTEYCLPVTTPHRVIAASGLCATLMVQGPAARAASEVFLRPGDSDAAKIEVRPTSGELLHRMLDDYGSELAGG
jgi:hypothetical protein